MNEEITKYWLDNYIVMNMCSLCGNSGIIHTEGIRTAAGLLVGRANYCICPNGQTARKHKVSFREEEQEIFDDADYLSHNKGF